MASRNKRSNIDDNQKQLSLINEERIGSSIKEGEHDGLYYNNIIIDKNVEFKDPNKFNEIYHLLSFHKVCLFLILKVDQLAASSEWGYICPIDNKSWDKGIIFYPEYDLYPIIENVSEPVIVIKVPLHWAKKCEIRVSNDSVYPPENLEFESKYDSMFPFCEILDFYIKEIDRKEIDILSKTYNLGHILEKQSIWKKRKDISKIQRLPRLNNITCNKILGGITATAIEEIFGILIDCGRINRNSKYIEPFGSYPIIDKNKNYYFDQIILGSQGFGLIYSLQSFINNGTILRIKDIEELYINELSYIRDLYDVPNEILFNPKQSIIWILPLIIKHIENLENRNALNFSEELKEVFDVNEIETSNDNLLAATLYAGFSASAISGKMWDNALDGIDFSKKLITDLLESITESVNIDKTESKCLNEFRNLFSKIEKSIKNYDLKNVVNLLNNSKISNFYFDSVFKSLSIIWATDTMSKDWYNVFNRAFNGKVKDLKYIFPILGSLMGFLHGYKDLNRRKNYPFSNDNYIEILTNNFIKRLYINKPGSNLTKSFYLERISECKHYNREVSLSIFKFSNGFELPLICKNINSKFQNYNKKSEILDSIISKLREKKKIENEINSLINTSFDR